MNGVAEDADTVWLHRDFSISPILNHRRRLRAILYVPEGIARSGVSLSWCLELGAQ